MCPGLNKSKNAWKAPRCGRLDRPSYCGGLLCFAKQVVNKHLQDEFPWPPATVECTPWLTGSKCDPGFLPGQCTSQIPCQEKELWLHFCLGMAAETTSAAWFLLPPHLGAVYHWRILWDCASKGASGKSKKLKHFCKPIKLKKPVFLIKKIPRKALQGVPWKEIVWLAEEILT